MFRIVDPGQLISKGVNSSRNGQAGTPEPVSVLPGKCENVVKSVGVFCENEWVILLEGEASIEFEDKTIHLKKGDYINIPSHQKHKVIKTSKNPPAIWLAIFY